MNLKKILETTREITQEVVARNAASVDRDARWPEESIRALQDAKLTGLVNRVQSEGLGRGLLELAQVCEILGQECASTAICFGMHCVGSAVISAKATAQQVEQYIIPINSGKHITTLALSEPGTGVHFYFPQTKLDLISEDEYRVTGGKTFVTNGGHADSYVVSTTAADPDAPVDQFSCIVVPREAPGLEWGPEWDGLGMRGNSSRSLQLNEVRVPRLSLLGEEGDQIWYVFHVVAPYFLIAMAGTYLGIAQSAISEAQSHLRNRNYSHSGTKLSQVSVVQHRLGCLWARVERTRRLIYHAASAYDSGDPDALPAILSAKAEVADCSVDVVNDVMTLVGGITYREGTKLHRHLRDARASHVMAPSTDVLRTWTGRALLEQPILGD